MMFDVTWQILDLDWSIDQFWKSFEVEGEEEGIVIDIDTDIASPR